MFRSFIQQIFIFLSLCMFWVDSSRAAKPIAGIDFQKMPEKPFLKKLGN